MSENAQTKFDPKRYRNPRHEKNMVRLLYKEAAAEAKGGADYVKESFTVTIRYVGDLTATTHHGQSAKEAAYLMEDAIAANVAELRVVMA